MSLTCCSAVRPLNVLRSIEVLTRSGGRLRGAAGGGAGAGASCTGAAGAGARCSASNVSKGLERPSTVLRSDSACALHVSDLVQGLGFSAVTTPQCLFGSYSRKLNFVLLVFDLEDDFVDGVVGVATGLGGGGFSAFASITVGNMGDVLAAN